MAQASNSNGELVESTTPRAAAPGDVRHAASNGHNGSPGFQTVDEYERNPDAQTPGVGNGIQISLDRVGAIIPVSRNNRNLGDDSRAGPAATPATVEEGGVTLSKASGGSGGSGGMNGNNKVLLSEVRTCVYRTSYLLFFRVLFPRCREEVASTPLSHPPAPLRPSSSRSLRAGDGHHLLGRHVRRDGPQRRGQDHAAGHHQQAQDRG
jgi:hypothetical protein